MADRKPNKSRETYIGTDTSGAEYWLVPFSDSKVGNRRFEIRNSKKQVPTELQGMVTDAATGERMFVKWREGVKASKKTTTKAE